MDKPSVKSKINAAAIEIFSEYGYLGASMDEIVKKAGVAKGSVYYHYESKEALFLSVIESGIDYVCFKAETALLSKNGREVVLNIIKVLAEMFLAYPQLSALLLSDAGVPEEVRKRTQAQRNRVIEVVAKALRDAQILNIVHKTDPYLAAAGCISFVYAYILSAKDFLNFSSTDCIMEMADILSRGLNQ